MSEMVNAQITTARVGLGGYQGQMLSLYVEAKFSNGMSGLLEGHYSPYLPPSWKHHKAESLLGHIIFLWLQATGAKAVEDMVGKSVRVEFAKSGHTDQTRIGHIVDEDKWFSTAEICEAKEAQS